MKVKSRTEYSMINIFTGFLGYGINTAVGFICRIVFVRILAEEYLGLSGLFSNILSMLSLAELGISSAITYALYKPIADHDEMKIAALMKFYRKAYTLIGMVVALIGLLLIPFLDKLIVNPPNIQENIYIIYSLYLINTVVSYFFSYRQSLLLAMQRQYIVTGYSYVITISQSILQTVFLIISKNYLSYLLIQCAGGIIYNIWISVKAGKDYPYILQKNIEPLTKQEKKSLFKNVKALTVNKISGILVNSTDNIAITFFSGLKLVGLASNYILFATILDKLITLMFNALTGSVGNLNATSDDGERYKFFKVLNLSNFWFYGWAAIGIAFVTDDLVTLFYGGKFVMGMEIPIITAVNFFSIGMLHSFYTYKSTLGLFRYGQYILFFTGIINLAFDFILGKLFGIFGIYLATLVARLLTNMWYEPYAIYKYGLKKNPLIYLKRFIGYIIIIILAGSLSGLLCSVCTFTTVANIVVKIGICTIIPNLVFFVCFRKSEEFIYLSKRMKMIVKMIHK